MPQADLIAILPAYAVESDIKKEARLLLQADGSILLLIDVQSRLAPVVSGSEACIACCRMLLAAARELDIPLLVTEHCPAGVGPTVSALRDHIVPSEVVEKRHFNGASEAAFGQALSAYGRRTIVVAGMEAHVCVLQTVLGLKANGYEPVVVADAIASRKPSSRDLAVSRMRHHDIDIVNTEMVLFEWLKVAGTDTFKAVLPMIKSGLADKGFDS